MCFSYCYAQRNNNNSHVSNNATAQKHTTTSKTKMPNNSPTIGTSSYTPDIKTFTVNGASFQMVEVRGGTFRMGLTSEQGEDNYISAKPTHNVTLSGYYIGMYEVTQELWMAVMNSNPSIDKGTRKPVCCISFYDCEKFISKLNSLTGNLFRLPTEAEWEFAARGGIKSKGYKYSGSNTLNDVAWYQDNSGSTLHDVGTKSPNELGLYDMSGNVEEWCSDWYADYNRSSQINPTGPTSGDSHIIRGGCYSHIVGNCPLSYRRATTPNIDWRSSLGIRLVLVQ